MPRLSALLVMLVLSAAASAAGYFHHADTLEQLRLAYDREDPAVRAAYFRGYVAGVADATQQQAWCMPEQADDEKVYAVVSAYLRAHPAPHDQDAASLVSSALRAGFPCPGLQ